MPNKERRARLERRIRILIGGFVVGLVLNGATAFPLLQELKLLGIAIIAILGALNAVGAA